jgi:hypothetical protein
MQAEPVTAFQPQAHQATDAQTGRLALKYQAIFAWYPTKGSTVMRLAWLLLHF